LEYCSKMDRIKTIDEAREFIINFIENDDFEQLDEKPRIILLSKEYRPEVISTVIWLRKFGIDIKCVEFKPYNLENNKLCFASTILIPIPNTDEYRINPKVTTNSPADLTVSQKRYLDFYKDLAKRINKLDPTIEANPEPKNYCQIPTEFGSIHFEWIIHKRPQDSLEVALHIERNLESSRKILNNLSKYTAEIEEKTGCKAKAEMWGKRWARIYIEKPENEMTEELKIWAVQKMKQLIDVLQPKLSLMKEIM